MKHVTLLFILCLAFGSLNAQQQHQFRTEHPQGFTIESSSALGISLHYSINTLGIADINNEEVQGQELVLDGCFASNAKGLPNLLFENRYIAIPQGAKVHLEVKENATRVLHDIDLLPAVEAQRNTAKDLPKYEKDQTVFGKDASFPADNVTIAQTTQIRQLDVVLLSVTPFRYNPVRKTLEVIYDMDIEIRFEGGNGQFGDPRYLSPEWDGILRDLVINPGMLPDAHYYEFLNQAMAQRETGCEYLIITSDDSAALYWADTLRQLRVRQGIPTKVVTTTEIGHTPDSIRDYVINAYNTWTIPPAAVLMLGGYNTNNGHGVTPYHYSIPDDEASWYIYHFPTDNPTVDVNGDSIPDMAVSRISGLRPDDYKIQIEKLIDYELNPPTAPNYYDHPIITSGYEYNKWFTITSQSINGLYRDKIGKHPTNLYMVYSQWEEYPEPPDSLWSEAPNTVAAINYFGPNGEGYIPASIGELHDWVYQNNFDTLIQAFEKESFLTLYRDHSSTNSWCCPWFGNHDVPTLKNKLPSFIFSIGCLTLNYYSTNDSQCNCLVDVFNRQPVGALGGIGAATITYTQFNDLLTWGMFDYIWPNFMSSLGSHTTPEFVLPSFSLVAGKLFLTQQTFMPYGWYAERVEATLNIFGYLGETYLNLYTETPQEIEADLPIYLEDQADYSFTVEAGAKICLTKGEEIFYVGRSTGETLSVALPDLHAGEHFLVTVTKQNRLRKQQEVGVIPVGAPYLHLINAEPFDFNGNGLLECGEPVNISLNVKNYGMAASNDMRVLLETTSPYVEILQNNGSCPVVEPDSLATIAGVFRIKINDHVPDQTELPMKVVFIHEEDSATFRFSLTASSPFLVIDSDYGFAEADGTLSAHIDSEGHASISVKVSNEGHAETGPISTAFDVKAPFVEVQNPHKTLESLAPGEQHTITFNLNTHDPQGAWVQTHFEAQYRHSQVEHDTVVQYGGFYEDFETDTLNPAYSWNNNSITPWDYSEEDPFEGNRCFYVTSDTSYHAVKLTATPQSSFKVLRESKVSFFYKLNPFSTLEVIASINPYRLNPTEDWEFAALLAPIQFIRASWTFIPDYMAPDMMCKIDHICFPPMPRTILSAGGDLVSCQDAPVELHDAYAYECDSILWITEGDGHFETDALGLTTYFPGNQDIVNGSVTLTLQAFSDTNSYTSTKLLTLLDELSWADAIVGDSVVNKYVQPVSHYTIEPHEGIHYHWQLEPAEAGYILAYKNELDIVWNLYEGDMEAMLSVRADNGCEVEPAIKRIQLVGTAIEELQPIDFQLFPNPTDGKVNLVIDRGVTGKAVVEVYNIIGTRMLAKNLPNLVKGERFTLDLQGLASGLYIVTLITENGRSSKKVSLR